MSSDADLPRMTRQIALDRAQLCFALSSQPQYGFKKASMEKAMWSWLFFWAGMPT